MQTRAAFSVLRAAGAVYAVEDSSGVGHCGSRSARAILGGSTSDRVRDIARGKDDQFRRDRQAKSQADFKNVGLFTGWNAVSSLPSGDVRLWNTEFPSHRTNAAEEGEN